MASICDKLSQIASWCYSKSAQLSAGSCFSRFKRRLDEILTLENSLLAYTIFVTSASLSLTGPEPRICNLARVRELCIKEETSSITELVIQTGLILATLASVMVHRMDGREVRPIWP